MFEDRVLYTHPLIGSPYENDGPWTAQPSPSHSDIIHRYSPAESNVRLLLKAALSRKWWDVTQNSPQL